MSKDEASSVSRRGFLKKSGLGLGVAVGALVLGPGVASAADSSSTATVAEGPFPYSTLDAKEGMIRGHAGYWKSGCSYGAFAAIVTMLREKAGGSYNQVPLRMTAWGRGGGANWGTLCGALTGACTAINLVAADADVNKLVSELMGWYSKHPFPSTEATSMGVSGAFTQTAKAYPKIELIQTVSESPLCHASNAIWIAASGIPLPDERRKERCARLTADVVAKTVSMLNDYKAGKFVATFHLDEETESCLECHEESQEGKMSCTECHDPH
ncbi:MAG: C-GCAxxG-C-C family protein [Spirochaetota bacterium]